MRARLGALTLKGFEKKVEVDGRKHMVKVIGGSAKFDEGRGGGKLLRIKITAEVDGVKSDCEITYGRYSRRNAAVGFAMARADAERLATVTKAITGGVPRIRRMKNGQIKIVCG